MFCKDAKKQREDAIDSADFEYIDETEVEPDDKLDSVNLGPLTLKDYFDAAERAEQDSLLLYKCPSIPSTSSSTSTTSSTTTTTVPTTTTTTTTTTVAPPTCSPCPRQRCPRPKPAVCPELVCTTPAPTICLTSTCAPCPDRSSVEGSCEECPTCPTPKKCQCPRCKITVSKLFCNIDNFLKINNLC